MEPITDRVRSSMLREAFIDWLSDPMWTHAMTFAYNRPVSLSKAKNIFGLFCFEMDRLKFGKRNVHLVASTDRFLAAGCFEHVQTNIHLHTASRLDGWLDIPPTEADLINYETLWKKCTRGSGDLLCVKRGSAVGWARYITKEFYVNDNEYILSSDFHPFLKLTYN